VNVAPGSAQFDDTVLPIFLAARPNCVGG